MSYFPPKATKPTPLAAIRAWCLHCLGETYDAKGNKYSDGLTPGKDCHEKFCPLFPYRTGRGPRKNMSDHERKAIGERLTKARKEKMK